MTTGKSAVLECVHGESAVLEEVRVEASIDDLLAEVTVTQRYRNPEPTNIEAVYTFPLPLDAVLLGFEIDIGDRKLAGAVVERSEAERRYEDAITDGNAAMLLEQAEPGLYTASVGNLLPGEAATLRFRYGLLLRWSRDRVRFTMPTTIAPRYGDPAVAGLAPHQAPEYSFDAERAFSVRVTVRGLLEAARFNSPSHDVGVAPVAEETVIRLTGTPAMDRDFVLEARISRPEVAGALAARDFGGWVALASFRPAIPSTGDEQRCCIKIVVDCSGSMGGDSTAQARVALERILDGLREGDLFEIIAFGSSWRALFGRETVVTETTLAQARRFVRTLDADMGGTEIGAALDAAYAVRGASGALRDVLLITDGEVWDSAAVIARARESGHRIFTVGVGSAVAEALVQGLAEATGGACELVAPREDMADRIHRHFQRMYAPRIRSAGVRWPAPAESRLPQSIETVYGGDTVHAFAWFAEKPEGTASLEVTLADGRVVSQGAPIFALEEGLAESHLSGEVLPATLARVAAARKTVATDDDKIGMALAMRYQLMSRWTNYIVIHVREDAEKAEDLPEIVRVPQVLAAGWGGMGTLRSSTRRLHGVREMAVRAESPAPYAASEPGPSGFRDSSDYFLSAPRIFRKPAPAVITPTELAMQLNARAMPPLPTLDELGGIGIAVGTPRLRIPDGVIVALRDLAGQGEDEEALVIALLYLLAESEAGSELERPARRAIIEAYKAHPAHSVPLDAVASALKDCPGWDILVPSPGVM